MTHPEEQPWIEDKEQLQELAENGQTICIDAHGNEHAINITDELQEEISEVIQ